MIEDDLDLVELDAISAETKATYVEIKDYLLKEDAKQPNCQKKRKRRLRKVEAFWDDVNNIKADGRIGRLIPYKKIGKLN